MRIAVWHNLPSGGGKRALYYQVQGLVARGHDVECWSLSSADHNYLPLSEFAVEHVTPLKALPSVPRLKRWVVGEYGDVVSLLREVDEACARSAREIEAGDFDVLFANSSLFFYMPFVLRHVSRLPKVLYLQEPCRHLYEASPILPWVDGVQENPARAYFRRPRLLAHQSFRMRVLRLQAKMEWLNAQACDLLLVNSYYSRESVLRTYGRDASVCYLGVDTRLFRDLQLERECFIVGLGSFHGIKGVDMAIRSVSLLPEPRPPLVWIANSGSDDYMREMAELAASNGVELRVKSRIPDEELVSILNRTAVLLYTPRLEPFGLATLEANACGAPVVAVAEAGLRETVRNDVNGLLVDRDPVRIAAALTRVLTDPGVARRLGKQGAELVRRDWNVQHSVDRIEAYLQSVVSAKVT